MAFDKKSASIILVNEHTYEALHIFNSNAFPEHLADNIRDCATRMVMFRHSARDVISQVSKDIDEFKLALESNRQFLLQGTARNPELDLVCYFDNARYMTSICSTFVYLRSLLGMYSNLIKQSIEPGRNLDFRAKKIFPENKKLAGGELVEWLRKRKDGDYCDLAKTIVEHSEEWIDSAVNYRNTLVHTGDIPQLHRPRLKLRPEKSDFTYDEIEPPFMPTGEDVRVYVYELATNVHRFVEDTIVHIPNVDMELVDMKVFPLNSN